MLDRTQKLVLVALLAAVVWLYAVDGNPAWLVSDKYQHHPEDQITTGIGPGSGKGYDEGYFGSRSGESASNRWYDYSSILEVVNPVTDETVYLFNPTDDNVGLVFQSDLNVTGSSKTVFKSDLGVSGTAYAKTSLKAGALMGRLACRQMMVDADWQFDVGIKRYCTSEFTDAYYPMAVSCDGFDKPASGSCGFSDDLCEEINLETKSLGSLCGGYTDFYDDVIITCCALVPAGEFFD